MKKTLWVRTIARTVEIFHEGQRVASHVRTAGNRKHTAVATHMSASHRRYLQNRNV
ncbi:Mu transposase domain-containing protein [Rhodovulum sulfidophilum]|uniref:Mu transposase domain-containing protein n=1 Tax=Rhodovulum sulfidophilum TaxID=35806 RepID=UPI003B221AF2